jgi:serine protease AprX
MKITFLSVLALFTLANVSAQSHEERTKIKSVQNKESIRLLSDKLLEKENVRKQRIAQFLVSNPAAKVEFTSKGRKYAIKDIVNGQPVYRATDNASEAIAIRTNRLYQGGSLGLNLDGLNMDAGIWDGDWSLPSHVEFVNDGVSRVTISDGEGGASGSHATHVTGTVGAKGINSSARGMASKANLLSYQWDNDENEVIAAAENGLLVSNHSYGVPIYKEDGTPNVNPWYMGAYSNDSANWDEIAFAFEYYLMVKSAGNEGTVSYSGGLLAGHDKLTGESTSKNNLVIANADISAHPITGNITSMQMNSSSSQGPSDDGRIKPDVAADGTNVFSSYNGNDTEYASISGTSMSAPCVTGSVLLLQQHYNNLHPGSYMRSATIKGLICHTATDDNLAPGPDPRWGWGLMNTEAAANVITNANTNQNLLLESSLQSGSVFTYNFTVGGTGPVKATLCWTDPVGNPVFESLNNPAPALVNDLDLRITKDSDTYFPWKLNLDDISGGAITGDNVVDNVERIDMNNITPGQYTITVSHKSSLVNGLQKYSLILSGSNLSLDTEKNELSKVTVWPNPAKDVLNVNFGQELSNGSASLTDMSGRMVFQTKSGAISGQNLTINTSGLSSGFYVLTVTSKDKSLSKKVIIE